MLPVRAHNSERLLASVTMDPSLWSSYSQHYSRLGEAHPSGPLNSLPLPASLTRQGQVGNYSNLESHPLLLSPSHNLDPPQGPSPVPSSFSPAAVITSSFGTRFLSSSLSSTSSASSSSSSSSLQASYKGSLVGFSEDDSFLKMNREDNLLISGFGNSIRSSPTNLNSSRQAVSSAALFISHLGHSSFHHPNTGASSTGPFGILPHEAVLSKSRAEDGRNNISPQVSKSTQAVSVSSSVIVDPLNQGFCPLQSQSRSSDFKNASKATLSSDINSNASHFSSSTDGSFSLYPRSEFDRHSTDIQRYSPSLSLPQQPFESSQFSTVNSVDQVSDLPGSSPRNLPLKQNVPSTSVIVSHQEQINGHIAKHAMNSTNSRSVIHCNPQKMQAIPEESLKTSEFLSDYSFYSEGQNVLPDSYLKDSVPPLTEPLHLSPEISQNVSPVIENVSHQINRPPVISQNSYPSGCTSSPNAPPPTFQEFGPQAAECHNFTAYSPVPTCQSRPALTLPSPSYPCSALPASPQTRGLSQQSACMPPVNGHLNMNDVHLVNIPPSSVCTSNSDTIIGLTNSMCNSGIQNVAHSSLVNGTPRFQNTPVIEQIAASNSHTVDHGRIPNTEKLSNEMIQMLNTQVDIDLHDLTDIEPPPLKDSAVYERGFQPLAHESGVQNCYFYQNENQNAEKRKRGRKRKCVKQTNDIYHISNYGLVNNEIMAANYNKNSSRRDGAAQIDSNLTNINENVSKRSVNNVCENFIKKDSVFLPTDDILSGSLHSEYENFNVSTYGANVNQVFSESKSKAYPSIEDDLRFLAELSPMYSLEEESANCHNIKTEKVSDGFLQSFLSFLENRSEPQTSSVGDTHKKKKHSSKADRKECEESYKNFSNKFIVKMVKKNSDRWTLAVQSDFISDSVKHTSRTKARWHSKKVSDAAIFNSSHIRVKKSHSETDSTSSEDIDGSEENASVTSTVWRCSEGRIKRTGGHCRRSSDSVVPQNDHSMTNFATLSAGEEKGKQDDRLLHHSTEVMTSVSTNLPKKRGRKPRFRAVAAPSSESPNWSRRTSLRLAMRESTSESVAASDMESIENSPIVTDGSSPTGRKSSLRIRNIQNITPKEGQQQLQNVLSIKKEDAGMSLSSESDQLDDSDSDPAWTPRKVSDAGKSHAQDSSLKRIGRRKTVRKRSEASLSRYKASQRKRHLPVNKKVCKASQQKRNLPKKRETSFDSTPANSDVDNLIQNREAKMARPTPPPPQPMPPLAAAATTTTAAASQPIHSNVESCAEKKEIKPVERKVVRKSKFSPQDLKHAIGRECTSETYLILRSDIGKERPPIWRMEKELILLQQFEPFEEGGRLFYKDTSSYAAWNDMTRSEYLNVEVRVILQSRQLRVVEYVGLIPEKDKDVNGTTEDQNDAHPQRENFEVFLQTLISQALDPNFISEITKENDEYFLSHIMEIDRVSCEKKNSLLQLKKWDPELQKCAEIYPCVNVLQYVGPEEVKCQLCCTEAGQQLVQFYGQPYDATTLGPGGSPLSHNTQFKVCTGCGHIVSLYSRLHHHKYNFFIKCRTKVNQVRGEDDEKESHLILEHCLQDSTWVNQIFQEIAATWKECDKL